MQSSTQPSATGHPLQAGRYELVHELARGGTGTVYLARLAGPGGFERLFAIKTLRKELPEQEQLARLLLAEGAVAARVRHPNVVSIIEVGQDAHCGHFLVMEYVDGVSLADLLVNPALDKRARVQLGLSVLLDALAGLAAAHRAQNPATGACLDIVHGDVTTSNILVGLDGIGRVADFGLARANAYGDDASIPGISGTPAYMSPEQASGATELDARSDIYSVGVVLWEVLTGASLIERSRPVHEQLAQVAHGEVPPPSARNPAIPSELDAVCLKALAASPDSRFQHSSRMRDALCATARRFELLASSDEIARTVTDLAAEELEERRTWLREISSVKRLPAPPEHGHGEGATDEDPSHEQPRPRESPTGTILGICPAAVDSDACPPRETRDATWTPIPKSTGSALATVMPVTAYRPPVIEVELDEASSEAVELCPDQARGSLLGAVISCTIVVVLVLLLPTLVDWRQEALPGADGTDGADGDTEAALADPATEDTGATFETAVHGAVGGKPTRGAGDAEAPADRTAAASFGSPPQAPTEPTEAKPGGNDAPRVSGHPPAPPDVASKAARATGHTRGAGSASHARPVRARPRPRRTAAPARATTAGGEPKRAPDSWQEPERGALRASGEADDADDAIPMERNPYLSVQ